MLLIGISMNSDILVAHPGKHHVLHLVAGSIKSGANVCYITPFYRSGIGMLVSKLPGNVGEKAKGYFHPDIPHKSVCSPFQWQLKKLLSLFSNRNNYVKEFDVYVAKEIAKGKYTAKVLVTLQDYMPKTVKAAKDRGFKIWSDQILNQSELTSLRIISHETKQGLIPKWAHDECDNIDILNIADVITVPSNYCFDGIRNNIMDSSKVVNIPYGANPKQFSSSRINSDGEIIILARAQSIRKGGHLLLGALELCGNELVERAKPLSVKVIVLGQFDTALLNIFNKLILPNGLTVEHSNIPHSQVSSLYQRSSLFVMPSLSEGRSLACLEAMHSGLPLIITPYCGIDGFTSGNMGYEVSDTVQSLSQALSEAFKNKHMWREWGENAKQFAAQFDWLIYEEKISQVTRELI